MRVGIIGCGGQGRIHAEAYAQLPEVQIVGCCDVIAEKAEQLASRYGAKAFTDFRKMLANLRPDIVSVCTLEGQHAEATIAALEAGAHVLCEKMLAASLDEGYEMLKRARQVGRLLATQFNYRHIPSVRWLKALLDEGTLGEPLLVTLLTHGYCHHHGVDLLRFLFGEIVAVQATLRGDRSEVPYQGWETGISDDLLYIPSRAMGAVVQFAGGFLGVLSSSVRYRLDDFMLELHLLTTKGRVTLRRMRHDNICGDLDTNLPSTDLPPFPDPIPFSATFAPSIHAFVAAVQGAKTTVATGDDGLRAMEVERALVASAQTGKVVPLLVGD